jgi:hypothetical protein
MRKIRVVFVITLLLIVTNAPLVHSNFLQSNQTKTLFPNVRKSTDTAALTIYNYEGNDCEKEIKKVPSDDFENLIESIKQIQQTNKPLRKKIELQLLLLKEKNLIDKDITYNSMWNKFNQTWDHRNNVFHLGIFNRYLIFDDIITNNYTSLNFLIFANSFTPGLRLIILDKLPKLRLDICGFLAGYIHLVETDGGQGHKIMKSNLRDPPRYFYLGFGTYLGFVGIILFGESDLADFTPYIGIGFSGLTTWRGKKVIKEEKPE